MLLSFEETQIILKKYKIPYAKSGVIKSEKGLLEFAKDVGYPLALKISNALHKTDVGGVILDIENKKELIESYKKISKISKEIIVQEMIKGEKIIMGAKTDSVFGPIVLFGLGGIYVEILKDISFRLAPITRVEAKEMISEIKGYDILKGARGKQGVKIDELETMLLSLSDLIVKEDIKEIDLNPVIANSKQTIAVDAKILA
ncbi:acetate--CoA ligase family protein [Patescibacteria group bacterium]|nr:acetate--CoA ligase family protein [Patescibacteria group bacterium]MBU4023126.1 acetate--CoA ligase family protein [Patescibacteria group bacterium]